MKIEKTATARLKKFLYYGTEDSVYKPGNRRNMKCYEQGNVPSIEELLSEGRASEIDECIKQVTTEKKLISINFKFTNSTFYVLN